MTESSNYGMNVGGSPSRESAASIADVKYLAIAKFKMD